MYYLFLQPSVNQKIIIMNRMYLTIEGGGNRTYSSPEIEMIDITTESGFAASDQPDDDYDSHDNGSY